MKDIKTVNDYNHWSDDLKETSDRFDKYMLPILKEIGFTNIRNIELSTDPKMKELDLKYGIDILVDKDDEKNIGIASRIQIGNYNSFSIREKRYTGTETEASKRIRQINNNRIYPKYTIQLFISDDIINFCLCNTIDLYDLYENHYHLFGINRSDNEFSYIKFDVMKRFKKIINVKTKI